MLRRCENYLAALSLIFITLKLTHVIDWRWAHVLLPIILIVAWNVAIVIISLLAALATTLAAQNRINKLKKDLNRRR